MAITSDKEGNPIVVTGTTNTDDEVLDRPVFIKFVYWYNPTTAGHLVSLKDGNGKAIVPLYCDTENQSQWVPIFTRFDAIRCDDMDSGAIYIYIA